VRFTRYRRQRSLISVRSLNFFASATVGPRIPIENRALNHPSDVSEEGQEVKAKSCLALDDRGKVRLSLKVCSDQENRRRRDQERRRSEDVIFLLASE